ncbi:hypothetical protein NQ176_g10472 [Zarea fungicola]|uniref:Uncharacterized protein n=1 Tax=Zarea fungicola TaxID=93591 RepID=A0ACC1MG25_9HYPO|nr:hypothetical protein NQ176_g10472 [Lecanicillium fungicola]
MVHGLLAVPSCAARRIANWPLLQILRRPDQPACSFRLRKKRFTTLESPDHPLHFVNHRHNGLGRRSEPAGYPYTVEKAAGADKAIGSEATPISDVNAGRLSIDSGGKIDQTHRLLKSRHIQLIGIGGSIGTVLYVRPL